MGSFFGSILVNLLPKGVGRAIASRKCPKVYVPNTGFDFEMNGYTLVECVQRIIDMIRADHASTGSGRQLVNPPVPPVKEILNFVLIDTVHCEYAVEIDKAAIEEQGVVVIDVPLVEDPESVVKSKRLDPTKVAEILISLSS